MEIPKLDDGTTPTNQPQLQPIRILPVKELIGKSLHIVEIRLDNPSKFHKKSDLYLLKAKDNQIYGFFNTNLRKFGIKAGDIITIKLVTGRYNFQCYEPVTINGKPLNVPQQSQPESTQQTQVAVHGLNKALVIKYATESATWIDFFEKIAALLPGTRYEKMPDAEKERAIEELYNKYKPPTQPDTKKV